MAVSDAFTGKDIVTLLIALYGAGLSTFVLIQGMRRERRSVVINQTTGFFTYPNGGMGPPMAQLEIVNEGHRPVMVNAPVFELKDRRQLIIAMNAEEPSSKFPARLEDGETATLRVLYTVLVRTLRGAGISGKVRMWPVLSDSTGRKYRGEEWEFDSDGDWANV